MIAVRRWRDNTQHDLLLAAVFYSVACTLVLLVWPGKVAARYAMPGTMTLAVICGLMFENWRHSHPRVIVSALVVTYMIFGGLLVRGWMVMPLWPHLFDESRRAGAAISSVIQNQPLYVIGSSTDHNILVYVRGPIRAVTLDDLAKLQTGSIAVLRPEEQQALARQAPTLRLIDRADLVRKPYRVVEILPK